MTSTDVLAIAFVLAATVLTCTIVGISRLPRGVKLVVLAGLALRFVGAYAREAMAVDAGVYFKWGAQYAAYFSRLDFAPIVDPALWRSSQWIGTNFVAYPTGLIIAVLGPSRMATFFAFGLLSFGGLVAFAVAYRRSFPGAPFASYWAWLFLLPSLWFWPSSIGKEALMTLGLGVATLGFAGKHGRPRWLPMVAGIALVYCVRPQVAAVFLLAVLFAYWLDFSLWSPAKILQGVVMLAFGLAGTWLTMSATLGGEVSVDAIGAYVDTNASRNRGQGSSIEGVGSQLSGIPTAVVNVLFRPFIWEAHNATALISAAELLLMWGLVWMRRRALGAALRGWRRHRMLRFAIPFVLLYVVALGMNLANLGLLARQRVLVFPLLFLVVEAGAYYRLREGEPQASRNRARARSPLVPA